MLLYIRTVNCTSHAITQLCTTGNTKMITYQQETQIFSFYIIPTVHIITLDILTNKYTQ